MGRIVLNRTHGRTLYGKEEWMRLSSWKERKGAGLTQVGGNGPVNARGDGLRQELNRVRRCGRPGEGGSGRMDVVSPDGGPREARTVC